MYINTDKVKKNLTHLGTAKTIIKGKFIVLKISFTLEKRRKQIKIQLPVSESERPAGARGGGQAGTRAGTTAGFPRPDYPVRREPARQPGSPAPRNPNAGGRPPLRPSARLPPSRRPHLRAVTRRRPLPSCLHPPAAEFAGRRPRGGPGAARSRRRPSPGARAGRRCSALPAPPPTPAQDPDLSARVAAPPPGRTTPHSRP